MMLNPTPEILTRTRKEEPWDKFRELLAVPKGFGKAEHNNLVTMNFNFPVD